MKSNKIILYTVYSRRKINFSYLPLRIEIIHLVRDENGKQVTKCVTVNQAISLIEQGADISTDAAVKSDLSKVISSLLTDQGFRSKLEFNKAVADAKSTGTVNWIDKIAMCCDLIGYKWKACGVRV